MNTIIDIRLTKAYTQKVDKLREDILHLSENEASHAVKLLSLITDDLKLLTVLHDVLIKSKVNL